MPPLANNSSIKLSRRIFDPGVIVEGVKPDQIQQIGENTGVSAPEFNAMQFIRGIIDEKSVSPVMQGQAQAGSQTAREIVELKQQSLMKMGVAILGVVLLERKMAWLRLYNILKYWTEAEDVRVSKVGEELKEIPRYKSITMDSMFDEGGKGARIVEFSEELPADEQVYAEEELLSTIRRKPIRKHYINPKVLRELKANWFIEMQPEPKETGELRKAMFMDSLAQGFQLFGPQSFNLEYLKEKWATMNNMEPTRVFVQQQQMMPQGAPQGMPQGQPPQMTQNQQQMMPQELPRPSVNTMASA
jgi:hypothetical protein